MWLTRLESSSSFVRTVLTSQYMTFLRPEGVSSDTERNSQPEISPRMTINALPDHILIDIFDFCRVALVKVKITYNRLGLWPKAWQTLVHVCSRWRYIVFSSPLRLNLCLYCTDTTSVRNMLSVWPRFPIEVSSFTFGANAVSALEHHDRVCEIYLKLFPFQYKELTTAAVMQKSFPALTHLHLLSMYELDSVLPDTFLGGSAPRLRSLTLERLPFPTLPQFLVSCKDLIKLSLVNIPGLSYITPEAMFTGLSTLTKLKILDIIFESPVPFLRRTSRLPPLEPAVFPHLTYFCFRGVDQYLDDLLARIDAPRLKTFTIQFFKRHIDMRRVISRLRMLGSFNHAEINYSDLMTYIKLYQPEGINPPRTLKLGLRCDSFHIGWQISIMAQICTQSMSLLSSVTELNFHEDYVASQRSFEHPEIQAKWLELFRPFTAVRTVRFTAGRRSYIVSWLRQLTVERVMEVLPALKNFYIRNYSFSDFQRQPLDEFFGYPATRWSTSESESSDEELESSDGLSLDEESQYEESSQEISSGSELELSDDWQD